MKRTAILLSTVAMLACAGGAETQKAACDAGDVDACAEYAVLATETGEWADAKQYGELACNGGKEQACFNLGYMLKHGMGLVEADITASREAFRMGCELEGADACFSYGMYLVEGTGGPPAVSEGIALLETECSKAHPEDSVEACVELWNHHLRDQKGPVGLPNVKRFAQAACDLKDAPSCGQLGRLYRHGAGLDPDPTKAKHYLTLSCDLGYDRACDELK